MKLCFLSVSFILCIVSFQLDDSSAGCTGTGGQPFYFGTSDLLCMLLSRQKRHVSRDDLALTHRWVYFRGRYYELSKQYGTRSHYRPLDPQCDPQRESRPAGYSNLSRDCLEKCTRAYTSFYGNYNLLLNNCHVFANRMANILCHYTACPWWCDFFGEGK